MNRRTFLTGLSATTLAGAASAAPPEEVLTRFLTTHGLPGLTAAWEWREGTKGALAVGLADREAARPMTETSRMPAASIGKSFVGALAVTLHEEGVCDLDAPLLTYLGRDYAELPNADALTLRNLLRHTGGIADHVHLDGVAQPLFAAAQHRAVPPEEVASMMRGTAPLFPAGEGWAYSDTGYILVGLAIEAATGADPFDLITERFIGPLHLTDTAPITGPEIEGLAIGYTAADNPFGLPPRTADAAGTLLWNPVIENTGGGLVSTARDLAGWRRALLWGRALSDSGRQALLDTVAVAPGLAYGAGLAVTDAGDLGPAIGHGGWLPGYVSSLRVYPDLGLSVAYQINSDAAHGDVAATLETRLVGHLARS